MTAHRSSENEKGMKKESESNDSDFKQLLEQMKLKNDALKKIYEFFETNKNKTKK